LNELKQTSIYIKCKVLKIIELHVVAVIYQNG